MKKLFSGLIPLKDLLLTWKHGRGVDNSREWLEFQSKFAVSVNSHESGSGDCQ